MLDADAADMVERREAAREECAVITAALDSEHVRSVHGHTLILDAHRKRDDRCRSDNCLTLLSCRCKRQDRIDVEQTSDMNHIDCQSRWHHVISLQQHKASQRVLRRF